MLGVVVLVFFLFQGFGDPARLLMGQTADAATMKNIRHELYLDQPKWKRFFLYLNDVSHNPPKSFTMMTPLKCDVVAMKTAARANPTLMLIRGGTILGKWSYADFRQAFEKISTLQDNPLPQLAPEEQSPEPADSTNQ